MSQNQLHGPYSLLRAPQTTVLLHQKLGYNHIIKTRERLESLGEAGWHSGHRGLPALERAGGGTGRGVLAAGVADMFDILGCGIRAGPDGLLCLCLMWNTEIPRNQGEAECGGRHWEPWNFGGRGRDPMS